MPLSSLLLLHYAVYLALQDEEDEGRFGHLRQLLAAATAESDPNTLKDVYLFAINYCARKIRQGRREYASTALELYITGIDSKSLFDGKELSPWTFTNVVKLALVQERYAWIGEFIERYGSYLAPAFRDNALHYNRAELYYYTQQYDQAQEELLQVAYSDLNYYLGARILLAKIYYETGEEEPLLSLLAAFTIFLKRNKSVSGDIKSTYLHFCELLFQLVRRHPRKFAELGEKIATTHPVADRGWLLQQYQQARQTKRN